MLLVKLNNIFFSYSKPLTIFQACMQKNIFIPRFCYHISLKIAGNCRMCLIEEKSSIKPLASCAVTISNGLSVFTNTELVRRAREGVLEYLLINHPLDCPICDQGGECDLQDQTIIFGSDKGRFYEIKRSVPNKNLGFFIKTFLNRCIQCARCTRFLSDIAGTSDLQLLGRGVQTEISTYTKNFLKSELSGNVIDLCPVGALTSKPFSFKARSWELSKIYTNDIMDGFASSIQIDYRGLEILRILPKTNKLLNDEWITDKTRFFYDSLFLQRLTNPFILFNNSYKELTWLNSLILIKNTLLFYLSHTLKHLYFYPSIKFFTDPFLDYETCFFLNKKIQLLNLPKITTTNYNDSRTSFSINNLNNLNLSNFENLNNSNLFLDNVNVRFESPILNLKLKKLIESPTLRISIFSLGFLSNFNYKITHLTTHLTHSSIQFINSKKKKYMFKNSLKTFTNNNYNFSILSDLSSITILDLNLSKSISKFQPILLSLGSSFSNFSCISRILNINLLHHVDLEYSKKNFTLAKTLLLPTKFYLEKFSTFCSNSFYFFDTSSHFSYKLPNTKEEWKIFKAFFEFCYNKKINFKLTYIKIFKNFNLFYFSNSYISFFNKTLKNSKINEFFSTNILAKLSPILSIASKKLTTNNNFMFTILLNNI